MNPIPSWPGRGRVTLVLLAVVPVALAYPGNRHAITCCWAWPPPS